MPSAGVARSIILDQEVSAAIRTLPKKQRKDARKMMRYSRAIGNVFPNAFTLAIGLVAVGIIFYNILYFLGVFLAILAGIIVYFAIKKRSRLIKKMNAMIAHNPRYWKSIQKKLETAVHRAGGNIIRD